MLDDKENREQNGSADDNQPKKRRRIRVSDTLADRPRTPYRSSDSERAPRSSSTPREGGYGDRNSYQNRESRNNYSQGDDRRQSYGDRSGNYNQGERSPFQQREGYGSQRHEGYGSQQREGYGNQRREGYGSQQREGYGNQRREGYGSQQREGYGSQRREGYGSQQRDGYSSQRREGYQQRTPKSPQFNRPKQESGPKRLVKPVKYKETFDPETEVRLNKYLANAGICSRREADTHITAGAVKVNGEVVTELGTKVTYGDTVTFNDQPVEIESKVYVLLNKPRNCVTTSDDPQNRVTVMDLVKNACTERIYPVGRLDRNTTGVLLLTNDGDLASKLMHPKFKKKKIYQVTLDKDVAPEDMQAIADGIELDDGEIHADSIAYNSEEELNVVGIEIHSGRNRIVRRIFEKLGYKVVKLDRVYFSGLTKKNVPRGKWRYLSPTEVNMLRMGAFE